MTSRNFFPTTAEIWKQKYLFCNKIQLCALNKDILQVNNEYVYFILVGAYVSGLGKMVIMQIILEIDFFG